LATLEYLNIRHNSIHADSLGNQDPIKMEQILAQPDRRLYINPTVLFTPSLNRAGTLAAFESDSDYENDELLRQELEMILLEDIDE